MATCVGERTCSAQPVPCSLNNMNHGTGNSWRKYTVISLDPYAHAFDQNMAVREIVIVESYRGPNCNKCKARNINTDAGDINMAAALSNG